MKRVLTKSVEGYELQVKGFENWSDAMIEIRVGVSKITIIKKFKPNYDSGNTLIGLTFPKEVENAKERLIVTLLLCYPNGLTIDALHPVIGAKFKTVQNWLTESSKGVTDYFEKKGEEYMIKSNSLYWALDEFDIILQNLK